MSAMGLVTTLASAVQEVNSGLGIDFINQKYSINGASKTFNDVITFTRASGGGRWNSAGQYEWLAADKPRFDYDPITKAAKGLLVEESRTNLHTYSQDFTHSDWSKPLSFVTKEAISSPIGSAHKHVETTANGVHFLQRSFTGTAGVTYTAYRVLKAAERSVVRVQIYTSSALSAADFDLVAGTVTGTGGAITSLGGGWYLCSTTATVPSTQTVWDRWYPLVGGTSTYAGDGVSGYYVAAAQLEVGTFPTSYIPTNATFVSRASAATYFDASGVLQVAEANVPRSNAYVYDSTGAIKPIGFQLESAATNLLMNSDRINGMSLNSGATLVINNAIAPDGTMTADTITMAASTASGVYRSFNASSSTQHTWSIFIAMESGANSFVQLRLEGTAFTASNQVVFDLSNGTISSTTGVAVGTITKMNNGWFRCSVTATPAQVGSQTAVLYNGTSASVKNVRAWGGQVEVGNVATSYIPTPMTFVSRASTGTYISSDGTIQTAGVNVPRIDYDPITKLSRGLLVEGTSTNMLIRSSDYNTWWTQAGAGTPYIITPSAIDGPRGPLTMTKLERTNLFGKYIMGNIAAAVGTTITGSIYAKAGVLGKFLSLRLQTVYPAVVTAWFNLETGACGVTSGGDVTATSAYTVDMGNGVYRCVVTATGGTNTWQNIMFAPQATNLAMDSNPTALADCYIDAAQVEFGTVATSHIPTPSTFTSRSSSATYLSSTGLLRTASTDVARDNVYKYDATGVLRPIGLQLESATTNLLTSTTNMHRNVAWAPQGVTLAPYGSLAPDGTFSAARMVESSTNDEHRIYVATVSVTSGATYSGSIWVKEGTRRYVYLLFSNIGTWGTDTTMSARFDTRTGAILAQGSAVKANVEAGPDGWFRISIASTALGSTTASGLSMGMCAVGGTALGRDFYVGNGSSYVNIWGPQFEQGNVASSYIPSTDAFVSRSSTATYFDSTGVMRTAATNVARSDAYAYDADNVLKPIGLLTENSATNLCALSNELTNAAWVKGNGVTRTVDTMMGPNGQPVTKFVLSGSNGHEISRGLASPLTVGTPYTLSVWMKPISETVPNFQLAYYDGSSINASGSVGVQVVGQWRRYSVTITPTAVAASPRVRLIGFTGGVDGSAFYLFNVQLEAGVYASSDIITDANAVTRNSDAMSTSASTRAADVSASVQVTRSADATTSAEVTRAADVMSSSQVTRAGDIAEANALSTWFNATEGTLVMQADSTGLNPGTAAAVGAMFSNNTTANLIVGHQYVTTNTLRAGSTVVSSVTQALFSTGSVPANGAPNKTAMAYKLNDFAGSINGGTVATDTSGTIPPITKLALGNSGLASVNQALNGHIASFMYYSRRLSNSLLEVLSR